MKVNNKLMIQSYLVTAARYDFSVYEKRIIYRLIEVCQAALEGQKLNKGFSINNMLFDDLKEIEMPVSAFLKDENDENYKRAKKALADLNNKRMEYENKEERTWKIIRLIELPKLDYRGYVKFVIHKEIYNALLDFSKGWRKYELKTAMEFESVYSMRFYELLSGKEGDYVTYKVEDLKIMFQLENKYKLTTDFIRRVIEPAQEELKEKAPFSFNYKTGCKGKKVIALTFFPYKIATNVDNDLERKNLQKQTALSWDLDKMVVDYLKQNYFFETDEIKHNRELLMEASKKLDIMNLMANKRRYCSDRKNPKGTLISILKKELDKANGKE